MLKGVVQSGDPNAALNTLASQNNSVASAIDEIKQSGGNGAEAFLKNARAKGMTDAQITTFLNNLKEAFQM